jgi:hypothetical protein
MQWLYVKELMMKIHPFSFILISVVLILQTACSSGSNKQSGVQAIEPTSNSVPHPTDTALPDPTDMPKPEPTAVAKEPVIPEENAPGDEEPTETPELIEDLVIFDTEKLVENLDDFVLRSEDMPAQYRLVEDGEHHITNRRVINTIGQVEGKRYIAASSRLDGWSIELERVKKEDLTPYTIFSQVEVFATTEGAQTAFGPDWFHAYTDKNRTPNWIEEGCDIADACIMYYYEKFDPTTELTTLQYEIAFVYKNVLAQVMGRSLDFDMNPEYVVQAAEFLFEKIDTAPTR